MPGTDDFDIPEEWPAARQYLQTVLPERKAYLESRDDAIQEQIGALRMELHAVRDSIGQLNESFRHVADQGSILMNIITADQQAQYERWQDYDKEHKELLEIARHTDKLISREDVSRFSWRLAILVGLYATLFAILVEKVA